MRSRPSARRWRRAQTQAFRNKSLRPSPWVPRKPTYIVTVNRKTGKKTKKPDNHQLLIKSGALRQSIGWKLQGNDTVVVSTDKNYAAFHQHGMKNMPVRPFFPMDAHGDLTPRCLRKINNI